MPKYRFTCSKCFSTIERITSNKTQEMVCSSCGQNMKRELPLSGSQQVTEIVDAYTGTKHLQDQDELLKKRREDHYWEVEVPRFVEKYSIQTCLEEGWLVYDDKGELVIPKAPSKR